jgi:hypothetical protein
MLSIHGQETRVPGAHRLTDGPLVPRPAHPRWKKLRRLSLALILIGAASAGAIRFHRPALEWYARLFRVNDPAPSDAIVVLLGGQNPDHGRRPPFIATAWRRGS